MKPIRPRSAAKDRPQIQGEVSDMLAQDGASTAALAPPETSAEGQGRRGPEMRAGVAQTPMRACFRNLNGAHHRRSSMSGPIPEMTQALSQVVESSERCIDDFTLLNKLGEIFYALAYTSDA